MKLNIKKFMMTEMGGELEEMNTSEFATMMKLSG